MALIRISGPNTSTRFRPCDLAQYIAVSASPNRSSAVSPAGRAQRDSDTHADMDSSPLMLNGIFHGLHQSVSDSGGIGRIFQVFEEYREFVASEARESMTGIDARQRI